MIKSINVIIAFMLLFFSCSSDVDSMEKSDINISGKIPDAYYSDFNITYTDSGILKVKITGEILEQYAGTDSIEGMDVMKNNVYLRFYNTNQEITTELKANHAIRYQNSGKMYASDDVIVINQLGEKLNTERLTWDSKTEQIICDTTVVITKPNGQKIVGSSLVSDQTFENYKITKVTGEINFNREEAPQ